MYFPAPSQHAENEVLKEKWPRANPFAAPRASLQPFASGINTNRPLRGVGGKLSETPRRALVGLLIAIRKHFY